MPTSEAPANVSQQTSQNQPGPEGSETEQGTAATGPESRPDSRSDSRPAPGAGSEGGGARRGSGASISPRSASRWVDYDTHELLERIGELEDERRWARLREGALWAVLVHILLIAAILLVPKYILKMAPAIETSAIQDHKDFTYLDTPFLPKPKPVAPLAHEPRIDKKTLQELRKESEAPPAPKTEAPPAAEQPVEPKPQPAPPIPPSPQSQSPVEAPHPAAVPARPNFAQLERSPADQLQQEMRNAMRGSGSAGAASPAPGLPLHPGASTGGLQILSDTQGVDFSSWLAAWYYETRRTWDPLIPDECNPPISKQGQVMIRFKVLPNGRLMDGSVVLEGRSGDVALDRAAWGALTGSSYPPLPKDFHGPYIELRAWFLYNMQPQQ